MMRMVRLVVLCFCVIVVLICAPPAIAQGQASFDIYIPNKIPYVNAMPDPYPQIGAVIARFSIASDAPVVLRITDVTNAFQEFDPIPTASGEQTLKFPTTVAPYYDEITLVPDSDINSPNRYKMTFILRRDSAVNCQRTQTNNPNHYRVEVVTPDPLDPPPPLITGVCLESWDGLNRNSIPMPTPSCTNANLDAYLIPIPPDDPSDMVATLKSPPESNQPSSGCFDQRPAVDVMMVLDKSGSMSTPTPGGGGPTRMDALHMAVRDFVGVWSALPPIAGDTIGTVFFDTTSPTQPAIPHFPLPLTDMTQSATATDVPNWVDVVTPGGATSIGAGLHQADQTFLSNDHRKVVLLMSDGQQNTMPFVNDDGGLYCSVATDPLCIDQNLQSCTPTAPCPLSNDPQIYTVTIGPSGSVEPAIAQAIATGFYVNAESNYSLLSPFFLELLQNFLRFNSYETIRIVSGQTPYSTAFPISTTSRNAAFSVTWPSQAPLRLTITPPGGAEPIVRESDSGLITVVRLLPLPAPFDPMQDWKIEVEALNRDSEAATTTSGVVSFNLHVMTDDAGIKGDLAIVPQDYKPGDKIQLRAKLRRFGRPMLGLGSHLGDRVKVDIIKPGQSIGDMLSDSTASSQSSNPDIQSGAEAKLYNAVQNDPSVIGRSLDTIQLFDDGNEPEHGDLVAGDGIYSARYPAILPGHYNVLFSIERVDPDSVRFSRQQLRTVYVRPFPDPNNSVFQTSVSSGDVGKTLSIVMTPRFKPGPACPKRNPKCGRMGPGWANYFWFTTPSTTPFKAKDNMDGTYTASLAYTGGSPPRVTVHFVDALSVIDDAITPDQLPQRLGPENELKIISPTGKIAVFLDAGAGTPHGTFGNALNTGFSFNAGLQYIATSHFSVEGIFGFHDFPAKVGSSLDVYQFSANGKLYLASGGPLRPFVNGGIGGYKFRPGATYFGGNMGGGILRELGPHWGVQASYNFHTVNTPGAAVKFSTIQGGIRFVF